MNTPQYIVKRNGFDFIFYDDDRHDEVQTMLDYMYYISHDVKNLKLIEKVVFVGDSNVVRAFGAKNENANICNLPIEVLSQGGRRAAHLIQLYPRIIQFRNIVIMLGGNDFNHVTHEVIFKYYRDLIEHLPFENTYQLRIVSLFSRKDCNSVKINDFNKQLRENFKSYYYPNRFVSRCHFLDEPEHEKCHLQPKNYHKLTNLMVNIANNLIYNKHKNKH